MAWKSLRALNHTTLKNVVKVAKQRLEVLRGESRELKEQEGIGLAYFRGKLSVGYSTKRTEDRIDFYDLNEIESIMVQLNSSSVAKVEVVLYSIILKANYPVDLTNKDNLKAYVEETLGIRLSTLTYQAVYVPQYQTFSIDSYSPKLGLNVPLASVRYDIGNKCLNISVKDGLYNKRVRPVDLQNGWEDEVKLFNQAIDRALFEHKKEAVLHLLDGIKRVGLSVSYNYKDDKVIIKDTDTGQVRLEGYVKYGKGYGTGFEYRFNYQEYYPDGTKHQYVKSYRTQVTDSESFKEAVEMFSKNL